jgi:hypothetical protein
VSLSGQTRYTFLVKPNIPNPDELINLIVIDDEVATQEYFIKYEFDANRQVRTAFNDTDMTQFTGTISYFDGEGAPMGEFTVENGETTNSDGSGTPCPPDDSDEPDDPDDPNDGNDGGPGNGGCTVNCGGDGHDDTTDEPGGGDGGGNGSVICQVTISYGACCNNNVEPHGAEECGCGDGNLNLLTITTTCQDGSRTSESDLEAFECSSPIGVIVEKEDCEKVKDLSIDFEFNQLVNELTDSLSQTSREFGYYQKYNQEYMPMELADPQGNTLKFLTSPDVMGMIHSHGNKTIEIDPETGEEITFYPVNMFSPEDINSFLEVVSNADGTNFDVSDVYSALITYDGNHMIRFMDDISNVTKLPTNTPITLMRNYELYVIDEDDKTKGLLRFLKIYNITNIIIYEFDSLGGVIGKYYDENGVLKTIEC